ncbi:MAG: DUF4304 domain-containing protein [Terracidiphilus sp.]
MASKTPTAQARDEVLRGLNLFLKERGFKRSGPTFNRRTADGLTHVVNLQISRLEPAGSLSFPDLTPIPYGKFTINLGVYVPDADLYPRPIHERNSILERECCIRQRLGHLCPEKQDMWWRLDPNALPTSEIQMRMGQYGLPFLDRFASRDAILSELEKPGGGRWFNQPAFARAAILAGRGHSADAHAILQRYIDEKSNGPEASRFAKHFELIKQFGRRLGLQELKT